MVPWIVLWFYGFGNIFVHFGDIIIKFFAKSSSFYALSAFRTFRCNPKPTKHHSSGPFIARTTFFRHFSLKKWIFSETIGDFSISFFLFFSLRKPLQIIPNNMVSKSDSLDPKWQNVSHGPIFLFFGGPSLKFWKIELFFYKLFFEISSTYLGGNEWFCGKSVSTKYLYNNR